MPRADAAAGRPAILAVAAAALAIAFDDLLLGDGVPIYRDLLFFVLPMKAHLAERLRAGELPLWNPFMNMGVPFLANWQSGVFYPPSALLLLPIRVGFPWFLAFHYAVALAGMAALARRLGQSPAAAAIAGLTFALGGYMVSAMSLTNHLQAAAWAPWVLVAWMRVVEKPALGPVLALAAALAVQSLGASPENSLFTVAVALLWTARRAPELRGALARAVPALAAAGVLAAGLCAAQLLPTAEYLSSSVRRRGLAWQYLTFWSLQPVSLLQLLFPHSSALQPAAGAGTLGTGFESHLSFLQSLYLGIVPLALAVGGVVFGKLGRFWALLAGVAVALALGPHGGLLRILHEALPSVVGHFRYPEKFLFVASLAAAVLAGEGAERVLRRDAAAVRLVAVAAGTLLAVGLAVAALDLLADERRLGIVAVLSGKYLPLAEFADLAADFTAKGRRLALVALSLLLLLAVRGRGLREGLFAVLFLAVVAADLASVHRRLNLSVPWERLLGGEILDVARLRASGERIFQFQPHGGAPGPPRPIPGLAPWFQTLSAAHDLPATYARLWKALYLNAPTYHGVRDVAGGDGVGRASDLLLLEALAGLPRERAVALLRVLGVRYLVGPYVLSVPGLRTLEPSPTAAALVHEIADPLPRAWLAAELEIVTSPAEALKRAAEPGFDPRRTALVERPPEGWSADGGAADGEGASWLEDRPERLRLRVRAEGTRLLVVSQSHAPGWRASVDGEPRAIHRTDGLLQGIVVGPGEHEVELVYDPASVRIGLAVSAASLAIWLLAAAVAAASARRRAPA